MAELKLIIFPTPQARILRLLEGYPSSRNVIQECQGAIRRKRRYTYRVLRDLHNQGFIFTKDGAWTWWRVWFGKTGFGLTQTGREHARYLRKASRGRAA